MKALLSKLKDAKWVAMLAIHFCVFSIALYGSALFYLVHVPVDALILTWGVIASVFGLIFSIGWRNSLE